MTVPGRIVALDVGDERIGVAASDPLGITAQPRSVIVRRTPEQDADAICSELVALGASALVVGLPLTNSGAIGHQAEKVLAFVDLLRSKLDIEIVMQDERFTTAVVARALSNAGTRRTRRKAIIDALAAQQILETYLARRSAAPPPGES